MMNKDGLKMKEVLEGWITFGLLDCFMAYVFSNGGKDIQVDYYLFFVHQGLEKICKTYLLAFEEVGTPEGLEHDVSIEEVDEIVRRNKWNNHNLDCMIKCVSRQEQTVKDWFDGAVKQHKFTSSKKHKVPKPLD